MRDRTSSDHEGPIAVLGAGTMGRGIAQVAAQAGFEVVLVDPFPQALERARESLRDVFAMLERKGRLHEPAGVLLGRIAVAEELEAARSATVAIEAAPERLELKRDLFERLSALLPHAVLATNTSTIPVSRIAAAAERPERVVGMHFFNPVPLMRLVEVIPGLATSPAVVRRTVALAEAFGKTPVVAADQPGFLVNRVARPFYGEALKLAGEGVPVEAIDRAMRGLGFRMGPFELLDLIGLDVNLAATVSVYEAFFHEPRYRPHPLQRQMVDAGRLGRKAGRGFYDHRGEKTGGPAEPSPVGDDGGGAAPPALVIGDGPLAEALRERLASTEHPGEAALLVDARVRPDGPLPTAAAGLPVASLLWGRSASLCAGALGRPVAGFSMVPPLLDGAAVELSAPVSGEDEALSLTRRAFAAAGFQPLVLPDAPGGVAFRILAMLVNEAASAVAEGLAGPTEIDTAMRLGTNYPLGPLEWSERLGLADVLAALEGLFAELGEDRYRPHPLLRRIVATGGTTWPGRT